MTADSLVEGMAAAVGRRVRDARGALGLTLDQLAERSGVSRRMIVNVEGGTANASLATLLRLATALQVPLASLIEGGSPAGATTVTRATEREPLWCGDSGGTADLIASSELLELWEWVLQPGEEYASEAHRPGTRELLHVHSGRLLLTVAGDPVELGPGDGAGFIAEAPHAYSCVGRKPVRFSMTVLEPLARIRP